MDEYLIIIVLTSVIICYIVIISINVYLQASFAKEPPAYPRNWSPRQTLVLPKKTWPLLTSGCFPYVWVDYNKAIKGDKFPQSNHFSQRTVRENYKNYPDICSMCSMCFPRFFSPKRHPYPVSVTGCCGELRLPANFFIHRPLTAGFRRHRPALFSEKHA